MIIRSRTAVLSAARSAAYAERTVPGLMPSSDRRRMYASTRSGVMVDTRRSPNSTARRPKHTELWDVLTTTQRAWADAYTDARSPLALMPREVPQPAGYTFVEPGGHSSIR